MGSAESLLTGSGEGGLWIMAVLLVSVWCQDDNPHHKAVEGVRVFSFMKVCRILLLSATSN